MLLAESGVIGSFASAENGIENISAPLCSHGCYTLARAVFQRSEMYTRDTLHVVL